MNITLKLYKSELMYDLQNDTHIIAQGRFNQGEAAKASYGLQADNDADRAKVIRTMQLAANEVKNIISSFLQNSSSTTSNNAQLNIADDDDAIVYVLEVSSRFNQSFTEALTTHCHRYIVNRMLCDWFVATKPELAKNYADFAELAKKDIQSSFIKLPPVAPTHSS